LGKSNRSNVNNERRMGREPVLDGHFAGFEDGSETNLSYS
jgi:hypothetical protein